MSDSFLKKDIIFQSRHKSTEDAFSQQDLLQNLMPGSGKKMASATITPITLK